MLTVEKGGERHGAKQDRARKGKGVCVWKEWEDRGRVREADQKKLTKNKKAQCVIRRAAGFVLIRLSCMCVKKDTYTSLIVQFKNVQVSQAAINGYLRNL